MHAHGEEVRSSFMKFSKTMPYFGNAYVGIPLKIDSTDNRYNKVFFKCGPVVFEIERTDSIIRYTPLAPGDFQPIDSTYVFENGKLINWNGNNVPIFNLTYKNEDGQSNNVYWYPHTLALYNDSNLNQFPITAIDICKYNVTINDEVIDIYENPIGQVQGIRTPHIKKGYRKNISYKTEYSLSDTIPLLNSAIKIDSIDHTGNIVYYTEISNYSQLKKIDPRLMNEFGSDLNADKLYLIDFFGSWCSPCIEGIKKIATEKEISSKLGGILTIACEYNDEDYNISRYKLDALGANWKHHYELIGDGFNHQMAVNSFPMYIIADGTGTICLISFDTDEILTYIKGRFNNHTLKYN